MKPLSGLVSSSAKWERQYLLHGGFAKVKFMITYELLRTVSGAYKSIFKYELPPPKEV